MDVKELRQKTTLELEKQVSEIRSHLHDAQFRVASQQTKKIRELHELQTDLARTLTVLNEMKKNSIV